MKVYVVFMWADDGVVEIAGVFDDEAKAIAVCKDHRYGIGSLTLNEQTPVGRTEWPGLYCPIAEEVTA